ncbi:MAG: SDR family NAD(P)-dependent oxidoreductase [Planctomycetota bacterium]
MPVELAGRPIFIAGASSGIGAATAEACAVAGMPVLLGARRLDRLEAVASRCHALGVVAEAIELDVTEAGSCERFVASGSERLGQPHAVFANAGYGQEAAAMDLDDEATRRMFETNYFGTLNILRPGVGALRRAGGGHALICSSCLGIFPTPYYSTYSATKAAQHHLGRAMDIELRSEGIRVSTVHPVGTKTEFFETVATHGSTRIAGTSERFMQPASRVADAIVRCLRRPRPEVWTSTAARLAFVLAGVSPRLTSALVRRAVERRLNENAGGT